MLDPAAFRSSVATWAAYHNREIEGLGGEAGEILAGVQPADVEVRVLNGTGRVKEGATTGDALAAVGFDVAGVGDATVQDVTRTRVRFGPDRRVEAELLVRHLKGGAVLVEDERLTDGIVELTTGTDYIGVSSQPAPATTTTAAPGATTTTVPATSTTRYGVVPGASDPAAACR